MAETRKLLLQLLGEAELPQYLAHPTLTALRTGSAAEQDHACVLMGVHDSLFEAEVSVDAFAKIEQLLDPECQYTKKVYFNVKEFQTQATQLPSVLLAIRVEYQCKGNTQQHITYCMQLHEMTSSENDQLGNRDEFVTNKKRSYKLVLSSATPQYEVKMRHSPISPKCQCCWCDHHRTNSTATKPASMQELNSSLMQFCTDSKRAICIAFDLTPKQQRVDETSTDNEQSTPIILNANLPPETPTKPTAVSAVSTPPTKQHLRDTFENVVKAMIEERQNDHDSNIQAKRRKKEECEATDKQNNQKISTKKQEMKETTTKISELQQKLQDQQAELNILEQTTRDHEKVTEQTKQELQDLEKQAPNMSEKDTRKALLSFLAEGALTNQSK